MRTIISDTCDVIFRRISDNKILFTADAQLASISHKITEEKIKGGIGNRTIALLRSDKEIELKVRNAVWDTEWMEMVNGTVFNTATNTVFKKEPDLIMATNAVTITGTPKTGGIIKLIASDGTQLTGTYATGKITVTGGTSGDVYTALYQIDEEGKELQILASKFAEKYYVEFQTIEYDIESNQVINDLYWIFNSVVPSGSYDFSFENGKPITPELSFTATATGDLIGKIVEVPRA